MAEFRAPAGNQLPQWLQALQYHALEPMADAGRDIYLALRQATIPTYEQSQAHLAAVKEVEALTRTGGDTAEAAKRAEMTGIDPGAMLMLGGLGGLGKKGLSSFFFRKKVQDDVAKKFGYSSWDEAMYGNYIDVKAQELMKLARDRQLEILTNLPHKTKPAPVPRDYDAEKFPGWGPRDIQEARLQGYTSAKEWQEAGRGQGVYKGGSGPMNKLYDTSEHEAARANRAYDLGIPLTPAEKKVIESKYGISFDRLEEGRAYTQQEKYPWLMGIAGAPVGAEILPTEWRTERLEREGKPVERFILRQPPGDARSSEFHRRLKEELEKGRMPAPITPEQPGEGEIFFDLQVPGPRPTSSIPAFLAGAAPVGHLTPGDAENAIMLRELAKILR